MTRSRRKEAEQSNTVSDAELERKHDDTPTGETLTADSSEHKEATVGGTSERYGGLGDYT